MKTKIQAAQYFATHEHVIKRGQLYGGCLPYTHHLAKVAELVERYFLFYANDVDDDLLVAAWLHDVVEDCEGVKLKEIREMFGNRVADLVAAVTNEPGANRKERALKTYPKIIATPDACIVKLADRLANVSSGGSLRDMYQKEWPEFKTAMLAAETVYPDLKQSLIREIESYL